MDGKSVVTILLVGGIGLYYLLKSKVVDAAMIKYQQKQIDDAAADGKPILVSDTGQRIGWVENTGMGPVPVVPTGSTPEQEKEAIGIFDQSLTITVDVTEMQQTGITKVDSQYTYSSIYAYQRPDLMAMYNAPAGVFINLRVDNRTGREEAMVNFGGATIPLLTWVPV